MHCQCLGVNHFCRAMASLRTTTKKRDVSLNKDLPHAALLGLARRLATLLAAPLRSAPRRRASARYPQILQFVRHNSKVWHGSGCYLENEREHHVQEQPPLEAEGLLNGGRQRGRFAGAASGVSQFHGT